MLTPVSTLYPNKKERELTELERAILARKREGLLIRTRDVVKKKKGRQKNEYQYNSKTN